MKSPHGTRGAYHASPFRRSDLAAYEQFTYLGVGDFGGKALGLTFIQQLLSERFEAERFPGIEVNIPRMTVLRTSVFDSFMSRNDLWEEALDEFITDDRIAHLFQKTPFPAEFIGDLMSMADKLRGPLAVRSSSRLEDALFQPFAGVYETKMVPNNEGSREERFRKLVSAIKFVYASMFFRNAKAYMRRIGGSLRDEKMAVVIQEVVGRAHGPRFYPSISGVARSFNYYPTGKAKPEQGVVNLALGLGKTIVDGGVVWTYCPAFPKLSPPVARPEDLLDNSQREFWAVNLDKPDTYDPIRETEYLRKEGLDLAEKDGTLKFLCSTWDAGSGRMRPGLHDEGPRLLDFAPLLQHKLVAINDVLRQLLEISAEEVGEAVEIEFAVDLDDEHGKPARIGLLQLRPMASFNEQVEVPDLLFDQPNTLIASESVLGNMNSSTIRDIVYLIPEAFDPANSQAIAEQVGRLNRWLVDEGRPYLLIGFGRWGSSDPWLGVPVVWSQISGASAIVEMATPRMDVDLSQGSHFFHNLAAFNAVYFSLHYARKHVIRWDWLRSRRRVSGTPFLNHVRLDQPLKVLVDGRRSRGVILHGQTG